MKKTILLIGNTSWGMYRFRGDLVRNFVSLGHKVVVVAPEDEYSIKIRELGSKFIPLDVDRKGANPFKDFLYFLRLIRVVLNERPSVVFTYTIKPILYGTIAAWLGQVPQRIAVTTGLGNAFSSDKLINFVAKFLYKVSICFASEVWFLNSDDAEVFLNYRLVAEKKVFLLVGEGVDVDHFAPVGSPGPHTFTLISRMLWDKGVGLFVEAARELKPKYPHLNFLLVGPVDNGNPEGISSNQLEKWNDEGWVKYLGPTDDVKGVLSLTTCLVHPTYYKEGLPRVLMEASAMGVPCITTDIPGCRDVIVDGLNGFLIPPRSSEALVLAIKKFIELSGERKNELSSQGRARMIHNFSSEKINSIYLSKLS